MEISGVNNRLNSDMINTARDKAVDGSFEKRLKSAIESSSENELKKVCREFESIFLNMIYKSMKSSIPRSDLIPRSAGRDIFESMLDEELVNEVSKKDGIGLADMLYKQLKSYYKTGDNTGSGGE